MNFCPRLISSTLRTCACAPQIHLENIHLYKINAEVHLEGIGEKDGEATITGDKADNCFVLELLWGEDVRQIR